MVIRSSLAVEVALRLERRQSVADVVDWLVASEGKSRTAATRSATTAIDRLVAVGVLIPADDPPGPSTPSP
jgi:hypothetical protein